MAGPEAPALQPQPPLGQEHPLGDFEPMRAGGPGIPSSLEAQFKPPTAAEYVNNLPHAGFAEASQRQELAIGIEATGLPVGSVRSLTYRPGLSRGPSVETDGAGNLLVHESLFSRPPEARLGSLAEGLMSVNSALRPENATIYGGEAERAAAAARVRAMAQQSLVTGRYLDGQHAFAARQHRAGAISRAEFDARTEAIAGRLALTDRNHLEQVEAAQLGAIDRLRAAGRLPEGVTSVRLTSHATEQGGVAVGGVDGQLATLLRRGGAAINNFGDFLQHVGSLKSHFYSRDNLQVAQARWNAMVASFWAAEMERRLQSEDDEDGLDGSANREEVDKRGRNRKPRAKWLAATALPRIIRSPAQPTRADLVANHN